MVSFFQNGSSPLAGDVKCHFTLSDVDQPEDDLARDA